MSNYLQNIGGIQNEENELARHKKLIAEFREIGIIIQSIVLALTTIILIWVFVKYIYRSKIDKINYFIVILFEAVVSIKLLKNVSIWVTNNDSNELTFLAFMNNVLMPLTYGLIQISVYLFIFELNRVIIYTSGNDPVLIAKKLETYGTLRFAAVLFVLFQVSFISLINFKDKN